MPDSDDISLLKRYADGDEPAFTLLIERYIHLVYSTALRQVGNPSHAEEISQAVFIILTKKAKSISPKTILSGWLYQTARLTAANFLRSENSRQQREQEAYMQSTITEPDTGSWNEIAPLLEEAMGRLGQADRDAIVLRFFENKTPQELATMLGLNEATARKRVSRALERLRKFFNKRGVVSTTAVIAGVISSNSVQAVPVGLANNISAVALANGAAVSTSTLTLVKGALKIMAWTKAKTAIVVGIGILVAAAATTTVTVREIHNYQNDEWQLGRMSFKFLEKPPYRTVILPTKVTERSVQNGTGGSYWMGDGRGYGINATIEEILRWAYARAYADGYYYREASLARTVLDTKLSARRYDYFSNLPKASKEALQLEIRKKFGLTAKYQTIETNVLLLEVKYPNSTGLRPSKSRNNAGSDYGHGEVRANNQTMEDVSRWLEVYLGIPVINQTGLTNSYDFRMHWQDKTVKADYNGEPLNPNDNPNLNELKRVLTEQLGLELTLSNMPVEMLVVEKAN